METNRAANHAEYCRAYLPGDVVHFRGRSRRYLVCGVSYYGGEFRLELRALGGADRGSSAQSVHPRALEIDADQTICVSGKRAAWRARDILWAVSLYSRATSVKWVVELFGSFTELHHAEEALVVERCRYTQLASVVAV